MKKSVPWIALGIALLALTIIVIYLIVSTHCSSNCNHSDIIGIIVSSVALVVSIYFIIIGLHARTIKKEFDDDIKKIKEDYDNLQIELNGVAAHNAKVVYDYYSSSIEMIKIVYNNLPKQNKSDNKGNYKEYIDKIKIARSRFVCNTSGFHEKGILLENINIMKVKSKDQNDIDLLDKVVFNPKNDVDIKDAARAAQKIIMARIEE